MRLLQENPTPDDCRLGAMNLLQNCAGLQAGESLLVVQEDPALGWYDTRAAQTVIETAQGLGASVSVHRVEQVDNTESATLDTLRKTHDCTIFFSRLGDRQRFTPQLSTGQRSVMCYARDAEMLGSRYGTTHHAAMLCLKHAVDDIIHSAQRIDISCPMGTTFTTNTKAATPKPDNTLPESKMNDVDILRFPMGIHSPISAQCFTGQVAIYNYVTSTGSTYYQPDNLSLEGVVLAQVTDGSIQQFLGSKTDVERLRKHYQHVSNLLRLNPNHVHSWHAGIHPGCYYQSSIDDNPDRWANNTFTHPKILHFHTCGDQPPGEIAWNIENPTVKIDNHALWHQGRLHVEDFPPTQQALTQWPQLQTLFDASA